MLTLVIPILGTSCSKSFLNQSPASQKTVQDFYQTPADAFQALVSAYNVLNVSGYGDYAFSDSVLTGCWPSPLRAAMSACQDRIAHFTRAGYL